MQEFDDITGHRSLTGKQAEPGRLGWPGLNSLKATRSLGFGRCVGQPSV